MKNHRKRFTSRKGSGITTVTLILVIALFAILPLGLLGFEISRYVLIQAELQNVADAAALAGTAALASSPPGYTYTQLQQLAMQVAVNTFEQNSILTTNFSQSNVSANQNTAPSAAPPAAYHALLNISLLDQNGNPQPTGSLNATVMRIQAIYSDKPVFTSSLLHLGTLETATANSNGGLPQLDMILCFDISGSMDDQSPVLFVNRHWNGTAVVCTPLPITGGASSSIYDQCYPADTGTGLNILPPQNLSYASYPSPSNNFPHIWSESPYPSPNLIKGLRINQNTYPAGSLTPPLPPTATSYPPGSLVPEQGIPPGNYNPTNTSSTLINGNDPLNSYPNSGFTDMIMQPPFTSNGFSFSSPDVCVEAARGNLESAAMFNQSKANTNPALASVSPASGWYNAYWAYVQQNATPIVSARAAATNFFYTMNISSNAHFGMVTFSDTAGSSASSVWPTTVNNVDASYTAGGAANPGFPVPLIKLNQSSTNYTTVTNAINGSSGGPLPLVPTGKTDISDALAEAISELSNTGLSRAQAKKAVILFTDGVPNVPTSQTVASAAALSQASTANGANIPIYTIGLSQNGNIRPQEDALLGDGNNGSGNGIAKISGNGATYTPVTNSSQLNAAFQSIARSLVVLQ